MVNKPTPINFISEYNLSEIITDEKLQEFINQVLSYNYNNFKSERKIIVNFLDDSNETYYYTLENYGHWSFNIFNSEIKKVSVYDTQTNEFLYDIINENILDYVVFS